MNVHFFLDEKFHSPHLQSFNPCYISLISENTIVIPPTSFNKQVSQQQKNNNFQSIEMIPEYDEKLTYLDNLVQKLQKSTIHGSAITMCLLPNKNINQYRSLLAGEIAQAANIKDKSNRLSVIQGLKSIHLTLKNYKTTPNNGLIIITATCMLPNARVYQKIFQVIQPHRPITKQVYSCDKEFSFAYIKEEVLVNDETFGFIVIDGNSAILATLKGAHCNVLKEVKSDIMRNHNKGGQSSVRFARLRVESRFNFVKVVCEYANKQFFQLQSTVQGYIIAGSADLKHNFANNETLSPSIKQKIIKIIDVAQGSEEGLKQAIAQSRDVIIDTKLVKEKQILRNFVQKMNTVNGRTANGLKEVIEVVEIGIAESMILCRKNFTKDQVKQIEELCKKNGCEVLNVSGKSQQGQLFSQRLGGIGAILRYEFDSGYLKEMQQEETGNTIKEEEFFL